MTCTCGLPGTFDTCCGPFLAGTVLPPTAEALLRARYSAFVKGNIDYIVDTHTEATRKDLDRRTIEAWSTQSEWLGLEILGQEGGAANDETGTIDFVARFRVQGQDQEHHEIATFAKADNRWWFVDGAQPVEPSFRRTEPKIGRNDPCSCGSGKKFKKCCGGKA